MALEVIISALVKCSNDITNFMMEERHRDLIFRGERQKRHTRLLSAICSTNISRLESERVMRVNFEVGLDILRTEKHSRPDIYAEFWVQR